MNKLATSTLALCALLAVPAVHAEQHFHVKAAVSNGGTLHISDSQGTRLDSTSKPYPLSVYAGYDFNQDYAIELGYTDFGTYKFGSPATVDMRTIHVAARESFAIGASFSVFGKLGVARHTVGLSNFGPASGLSNKVHPLAGVGAEYRLMPQLSLSLELVDYGTVKSEHGRIKSRQLEAGVSYHF